MQGAFSPDIRDPVCHSQDNGSGSKPSLGDKDWSQCGDNWEIEIRSSSAVSRSHPESRGPGVSVWVVRPWPAQGQGTAAACSRGAKGTAWREHSAPCDMSREIWGRGEIAMYLFYPVFITIYESCIIVNISVIHNVFILCISLCTIISNVCIIYYASVHIHTFIIFMTFICIFTYYLIITYIYIYIYIFFFFFFFGLGGPSP
jgi:hypothetical protein